MNWRYKEPATCGECEIAIKNYERGKREGRSEATAEIVGWLLRESDGETLTGYNWRGAIMAAARMIEGGRHIAKADEVK